MDSLQKLGSVRRSTWESYEGYVRLHLKPGLGRLALAKLQPARPAVHDRQAGRRDGPLLHLAFRPDE
ncbi:MAG: hypothetical protein GEU73_08650 [Chloroflexi bacterium]|nr:hypothetical protein [Chloroflexota bacterium]